MKVEFFRHNIGEEEIKRVTEVLNSIFLTTGKVVFEFEELMARYLKSNHVIGLTSATAALQLSLLAYNIGEGDEVITTPLSFVASANAIIMAGATPVFVDVEEDTGNINVDLIESVITERTKAILPVHLYGQMCDMVRLNAIAKKYGLLIIEDAAHCLEGERDGYKPGQLADTACFSFYATKSITSGEGGAVSTNDAECAKALKMLRLHGLSMEAIDRYTKKYQHYDMEIMGWKYNMDNIQAALLLGQLKRVEEFREKRVKIWQRYTEAFQREKKIDFPKVLKNTKHAYHLFTIWVNPEKRDQVLWELQAKGVGVAVNFRPIHLMKYYRKTFGYKEGTFPVAEKIGSSTVTLPLYPKLKDDEVEYVIKVTKEVVNNV